MKSPQRLMKRPKSVFAFVCALYLPLSLYFHFHFIYSFRGKKEFRKTKSQKAACIAASASRCFVRYEHTHTHTISSSLHLFAKCEMKANGDSRTKNRKYSCCMYVTCLQQKEKKGTFVHAYIHIFTQIEPLPPPPPMLADRRIVCAAAVHQSVSYLDCISARLRRVYAIYLLFQNLFVMLNCVLVCIWCRMMVSEYGRQTRHFCISYPSPTSVSVPSEKYCILCQNQMPALLYLQTDGRRRFGNLHSTVTRSSTC